MKVGIMQPYFFPYIGYWQLLNTVDKYVIYDDVNYIKRGWINRNRILLDGVPRYFNVRIVKASQNKLINETCICDESARQLSIIKGAYCKARYFECAYPLIEECLRYDTNSLTKYLVHSIGKVCAYLSIKTEILYSSSIPKDLALKGERKILNICKTLGASEYYNPVGGKKLYSSQVFKAEGIKLKFLKSKDIKYEQFKNTFYPNLSIIDVMMFNSPECIHEMLDEYVLE